MRFKSIDFGARYADHERKTESPEGASPGDIWSDLQNGETAPYPSDFASNIDGTFPRDLWYFTPNALKEAILANSTWLSNDDGATGRHNYGGEWKVTEKNLAAYVQANFGNDAWSGNVGLRYVNIDQEINSYQAVASAASADVSSLFGNWIYQNTNNKHNKVLPSANLKFHMRRRRGVSLRGLADHDSAGLFGIGRFQLGFGSEQDRRRWQPEPEAGDVHQLRRQPRVVFHAARPACPWVPSRWI